MGKQRAVLLPSMFNITRQRKSLSQLLRQLAGDGARVAEAELAQARSELGDVIRNYIISLVLGAAGLGMMIVAVMMLSHATALALAPYLQSEVYAYLSVGLVLAVITIILIVAAYNFLVRKLKPVGLIFKWFADATEVPKPQL
jgi:Putative Actinobacterial Holin-X, holin superfamily III